MVSSKTENRLDKKDLVGSSNESEVSICGIKTKALLDTGSCVSTINEEFYNTYLSHLELRPVEGLLNIECADGNTLPYSGVVEADLAVKGIPVEHVQHCLFLVVPESKYSRMVPILLGTNILAEFMSTCKDKAGDKYLQDTALFTPWFLAFRCMAMREKTLQKNCNRLAIVRCAEQQRVLIKPNSTVSVKGCLTKETEYQPTCAIIEPTKKSVIPEDLDIAPSLITYNYKDTGIIDVNISNVTTRTVSVSPTSVLCELQPVVVDKIQMSKDESKEKPFVDEVLIENPDLTEDQVNRVKTIITEYEDLFSKDDADIGHYTGVKHHINLSDETPFKQRYRRIPPAMIDEVRSHLEQLLAAGIIRKSHSPFASNVVLVRKKDGKLRMCVDYRFLNNRTIKDSYALPRIEDILDTLSGSSYFTVCDMKSGYHQLEILDKHKERTAFTVGPLGFFEFNRLPFGLCNAPATYQRVMEECLGDLNMKICVIYLDDLIIFSKTFEEHLERLQIVLDRLRECNLKLGLKKCEFLRQKVKYVGFIVSKEGVSTDPQKVEKVRNWPTPKCPEEVRQFVAFSGFYRKFIKDFSKIVKPLSKVMPPQNQKKGKKTKSTENTEWEWGIEQENAFRELKFRMTSAPILAYADYDSPFELHVDASKDGLGAVLYQCQEEKQRVISFASRSLNKSEQNYSTMKLEFLALKWAITEKFNDYLLGREFTVMTDNNPLTYILTSAKLDATGQRWVSELANFTFDILYKPGKKNVDADAMSRYPTSDKETEHINFDSVKAICSSIQHSLPLIQTVAMSLDVLELTDSPGQPMAQVDIRELRKQQREDSVVGFWVRSVKDRKMPKKQDIPNTKDHLTMSRSFNNLKLIRGVLYREVQENDTKKQQLVLPSIYRKQALQGVHDCMGHPGRERTLSILKDRFFWPGITADTELWIKQCGRCLRRKSSTNMKAPLVNITSTYPLELVCMDYLSLEPSKGGIGNVLVITDHYTRYALAIPTKNQTAKTTAEAFFNHFIINYGIPSRIHSDQGANFESDLIKELCTLMGMKKSRTTVYHPMSNGMTERFNRTLIGMLGTLEPEQKQDWKKYISPLVYAYNTTKHESTGYTPYELMFGRTPKLPIDLVFGMNGTVQTETKNHSEFVQDLRERLQKSFEIVKKSADGARQKQKENFDKSARASNLEIGDKVLVKILAFEGKHKIADKFEEDIYTVVDKPNRDIPVYIVRNNNGRDKTFHRNHLLPVGVGDTGIKSSKTAPQSERKHFEQKLKSDKSDFYRRLDSPVSKDIDSESEDDFRIEILHNPSGVDGINVDEENNAGTVDDNVVNVEQENVPRPVQIPRRSTRHRQQPKWHSFYQMNQISVSPSVETKEVLANLMCSGVLYGVSVDIVNRIVDAIVK